MPANHSLENTEGHIYNYILYFNTIFTLGIKMMTVHVVFGKY